MNDEPELIIPDGVTLEEAVVYASVDGRDLHGDLFSPCEGKGDAPGLVFIHGGGWSGGTRTQFHRHAARMASLGFMGLCVEYRLSGESRYPAAVDDVASAVRWMREREGVDGARIGSVGGSAGGHLAAMLATKDVAGDRVSAAVCFNPVMDPRAMMENAGMSPEGAVPRFLGGMPDEMPDVYTEASPLAHVDAETAPTLMLHGTSDTTVPIDQSIAFLGKLADAGVWGELASYAGAAHGFFNREPWYTPTLARMEEFLERQMQEGKKQVQE